ncbi:MAG: hypothetical protein J6U64_04410 [Alphaproteobacteria bacterium]|nr:hypothetical protein [Alphaproteobacteria bacterium]
MPYFEKYALLLSIMKRKCKSSELYPVEKADIYPLSVHLENGMPAGEIAILLGNEQDGTSDTVIGGLDLLEADDCLTVPVRFYFTPSVHPMNLFVILCRKLRYKKKQTNINVYHINPNWIRQNGLERAIKTRENAYNLKNKKYARPLEERLERYDTLKRQILQKGWKDDEPLIMMLNRRFGLKDCLDNGHHRMSICIDEKIERVTVKFAYMSRVHPIFEPFIRFMKRFVYFKKD